MEAAATSPLYLGLDLSTQQLKAILITQDSAIIHESSVHFDHDLPHYGTTNGAVRGPGEGEVTSPVSMWLEAIDLLLERMRASGINFNAISAISGAGQQHGSVYWSSHAELALSSLDPMQPLTKQLFPRAFSNPFSPIWQDSSTSEECKNLEQVIGGAQILADLTGSRAYERFTGNQIAKIRRIQPEIYKNTTHISLISSFIPSLFLGRIAPIEVSDASGMNLMNVLTCKWDPNLLEICGGPELRTKLGPEPAPGGSNLGTVSDWWVRRWGFSSDCIVTPFTGDNPATVVALSAPGDALLSLGTSTTFLLSIPPSDTPPKRYVTSHLLSSPTSLEGQIAMLCYKNGALAREQIRNRFADSNWDRFNQLIEETPVGCGGYMGLYFPLPEIIPPNVQGEFFFTTSMLKTESKTESKMPLPVENISPAAHPRAILESQFLSIRSRIAAILPTNAPPLQRLIITGGSSANQTIRQLAADIFGMKVYISATKEAAGMGGALLAKYARWKFEHHDQGSFEDMSGGEVINLRCVAEPKDENTRIYEGLVAVYTACEEQVVTANN